MFFLVDQEESFPITFPAKFQAGVLMREAVMQPKEVVYPPDHRYWMLDFTMQLSTPVFLPNGTPVSNPTSTAVSATGTGRTATEPV
jgi:hypothetical protein